MSRKTAAAAIDDTPPPTNTEFSDTNAAALWASDPDLAAEIYGEDTRPAATGTPPGDPPADPATPPADPTPPPVAAAPAAPVDPAAPAAPAAPIMVPKSRLDEVLARLDAAEARLNQQVPAPAAAPDPTPPPAAPAAPAFDLAGKLREKLQAQWDGNEDRVIELELEIEAHRQAVANATARAAVQEEQTATTVRTTLATAAEKIITDYPALDNRNAAAANPAAITAFIAERDAQLALGHDPVKAMNRAALLVATEFGLAKAAPAPTPTPTPPAPGAGGGTPPLTARQVDVARFAANTANTPPNNVGGRGQGDIAAPGKEISRAEWANMTEKEKNEALGIE